MPSRKQANQKKGKRRRRIALNTKCISTNLVSGHTDKCCAKKNWRVQREKNGQISLKYFGLLAGWLVGARSACRQKPFIFIHSIIFIYRACSIVIIQIIIESLCLNPELGNALNRENGCASSVLGWWSAHSKGHGNMAGCHSFGLWLKRSCNGSTWC